jgi:hypothetical protein
MRIIRYVLLEIKLWEIHANKKPELSSQAKTSRSATSSRDRGAVRCPADVLDPLLHLGDLLFEVTGGAIDPLQTFEVVAEDLRDLGHRILC